jgi:hypothetical protein
MTHFSRWEATDSMLFLNHRNARHRQGARQAAMAAPRSSVPTMTFSHRRNSNTLTATDFR